MKNKTLKMGKKVAVGMMAVLLTMSVAVPVQAQVTSQTSQESVPEKSVWESGNIMIGNTQISFPAKAGTAEEICRLMEETTGKTYHIQYCQYHKYVEPFLSCDAQIICDATGELIPLSLQNITGENCSPQECAVVGISADSIFHQDVSMITLPEGIRVGDSREKVHELYGDPSNSNPTMDFYYSGDAFGEDFTFVYFHYENGKIVNCSYHNDTTYTTWARNNKQ